MSDAVAIDGVFEEEEARYNDWWIWGRGRGDIEGTKDLSEAEVYLWSRDPATM